MLVIKNKFTDIHKKIKKDIEFFVDEYEVDDEILNNLYILENDCEKIIKYLEKEHNKYIISQKIDENLDVFSEEGLDVLEENIDDEIEKEYKRKTEQAKSTFKSLERKYLLEKEKIDSLFNIEDNSVLGKVKKINTIHNKELAVESIKMVGEKSKPIIDKTKKLIMNKDYNRIERKIKVYYEGFNYRDKMNNLLSQYEEDCKELNITVKELSASRRMDNYEKDFLVKEKSFLEKRIKKFENIYIKKSKNEYVEPISPFNNKIDFISTLNFTFGGIALFMPLLTLFIFMFIFKFAVIDGINSFGLITFPILSFITYILFKGFFDDKLKNGQSKITLIVIVLALSLSMFFIPLSYFSLNFISFICAYFLLIVFLSAKQFNKTTLKLLKEKKLDIVYIYNELDKTFFETIERIQNDSRNEDLSKVKSLIALIQHGYANVYKQACNHYYGVNEVEKLNIERLKNRITNNSSSYDSYNNNSGSSMFDNDVFGNGNGGNNDIFGGFNFDNDDDDGMFGIDDEFGIDINEKVVDEGDMNNPRFEEWITFFEQKYNKKRDSEEWSSLDIRVPKYIEVEENPNLEIHIIPQLSFNKKMLENQVAVLERLFKMKVMRIYDNYNNQKELAIEFAQNLIIPPYNYDEVELTKDDTFEIGKTLKGERVKVGIDDVVHINIGGGTGSGKTVAMFNIVNQIIYKGDMIVFIDCKNGVSFSPCKQKGYTVITNNEVEELRDFVKLILEEMKKRNEIFINSNVSNLERYKEKQLNDNSLPKIPRLYIFFDELNFLSEIKTDINKEILTDLQLVWSQGRSAGIHMIDALQKPLAKFFGDTGKSNHFLQYFGIKVFEKAIEDELGKEFVDKVAELPRAKKDRGHFYAKTEEDVFYFRSPYINESDYIENVMIENKYKDYILGEARMGGVSEKKVSLNKVDEKKFEDVDFDDDDIEFM